MFEDSVKYAKEALLKSDFVREGFPEPQAILMDTGYNCTYISITESVEEICNELIENGDTRIYEVLAIWKNGQADLPCVAFRKGILEMNPENKDTVILLQGEDGYIEKTLYETLL